MTDPTPPSGHTRDDDGQAADELEYTHLRTLGRTHRQAIAELYPVTPSPSPSVDLDELLDGHSPERRRALARAWAESQR